MGWGRVHGLGLPAVACQDVSLKMTRSSQLLHFAFREDKQWKLQQVINLVQPGFSNKASRGKPRC